MNGGGLQLGSWVPFFTAAAGASAALVGLIIVAMSVNVETIVGVRSLPARAISTIASLTYVVIASVFALVLLLLAVTFVLVFITSVLSAWVLLIEIRR